MAIYQQASDSVLSTIKQLIDLYHPRLKSKNIVAIFKNPPSYKDGYTVYTNTRKPPQWLRAFAQFAETDFVIEIAETPWEGMTTERRKAMIDHALCACGVDEDENCFIAAPEIVEFREVWKRWGAWNERLMFARQDIEKGLEQATLPMDIEMPEGQISTLPEPVEI